ncbi:MAG: BREX system Lon protease-like protein BrxL [Verrucomicrobiae bacterium]|nr:BREX system Lon protease-like protein BrxL [Verrucomicrobiae bacterium]NNJ42145.1 BREX system Lon protease-like protein BrxL [Akkermansiaceae bacterium]
MKLDDIDNKLTEAFEGRCVRKDLVQRIKKGTNIPTFVLEFLLARYCASDDPDEINEGLLAVTETIQLNYVRPNEANKAQSMVQQKGKHKYIDKVHVHHNEKEKRHWAEMQNFGSKRIAINERHYRDNNRLLEGGLWCEVTVGYNEVEDDDYTFYIEELRPIQISRFSFEDYCECCAKFSRDEWLAIVLRTLGLEPNELTKRQQFHFLSRLFPLIEQNYNFLELGPRGTGKSYVYSEFTPYSTLISGGQTTTATLFYNKQRRQVGIIGYWDTIAFDEVAGIKVKDPGTIQILKDYMANGHFNLGAEVMAPASLSFVGNIDDSIEQLVASEQHDLCRPLPKEFDLAVIHRFHAYMPGWEIPPNSSKLLTDHYGLITDYLAEAFHHLFSKVNLFSPIKSQLKLNNMHEGRDETAVIKTVAAFCKMLHPGGEPSPEELDEYTQYAIEGRRRVKEQLNKRKKDDEFGNIKLGFINAKGQEVIVHCPESKGVDATQSPRRKPEEEEGVDVSIDAIAETKIAPKAKTTEAAPIEDQPEDSVSIPSPEPTELKEKEIRIFHGDRGFSYRSLFLDYLQGAKKVRLEDPYIRRHHQITNFLHFCEVCVDAGTVQEIHLTTSYEDEEEKKEAGVKIIAIAKSLAEHGIKLDVTMSETLHDRRIELDNGWTITLGRGLDFYQRPDDWLEIGANELNLRQCTETTINYRKV